MQILSQGSPTTPAGYRAATTSCGFKRSGKPDLALLVSDRDCSACATFTQNQVQAAPVIVDRETLAENAHRIRAVVANAGIANACTGTQGLEAARATQRIGAEALDCAPGQVLLLSTGLIGAQLDLEKLSSGIATAAMSLSPSGGRDAARAIMTTDTRAKRLAVRLELTEGNIAIGGMAKGSGMIHPNMATMLAVLTTDAQIPPSALSELLPAIVDRSFNRISVDGDTSTNDTVLLLANGASGIKLSDTESRELFAKGLAHICAELAKMIVRDGEGASKFVSVEVAEARTDQEAAQIARLISTSPLVKTAIAGGDPNWGRVLAAAGRAGIPLDPDRLGLVIHSDGSAPIRLVSNGASHTHSGAEAARIFASPEFSVRLELGLGDAHATVWTCDLTQDYVKLNSEYST